MNERQQSARESKLHEEWQQLCELHLPVSHDGSPWRYHLKEWNGQPSQGWKLHISATVLNAGRVLRKVAPLLGERGVQFKAPRSLRDVIRLNSGISEGYSQVGKIITVYSRTTDEAVQLASRLHALTLRMAAPSVPFDLRYKSSSNVYYRFGGFQPIEIKLANGKTVLALREPSGELIPDDRQVPKPDWVNDPFEDLQGKRKSPTTPNPIASRYRIIKAIVQRGKGGVYQAVDLTGTKPRLCLIKEGRKFGELSWDGSDGNKRIKKEEQVLRDLHGQGLNVPRVLSSFHLEGNSYLVTEFVEGETLQQKLARLQRRMKLDLVYHYGIQLSGFLSKLHAAGWVWRDCKPLNLIVNPKRELRPLDFEGAIRTDKRHRTLWGTPGFIPPEWNETRQTGLPDDLYALGAILYLLTTGRTPELHNPKPAKHWRRNLPVAFNDLIMSLLDLIPEARPQASVALKNLSNLKRDMRDPPTRSFEGSSLLAGSLRVTKQGD